jgi:tetratricopeptide (TPR) repeat protein
MRPHNVILVICLVIISANLTSCKKYLDKKADESLSTPSTLDDLQALADDPNINRAMDITNTSSDEYYVTYTDWLPELDPGKSAYIWSPDVNALEDWKRQYISVFNANTILDNLKNISVAGQEEKANSIKGSALFIRAHCFYQLAQLYAPQYDPGTAATDLGIPLRLNSNFNEPSIRSSVKETYVRIIQDLQEALSLLPVTPLYKVRPSKPACYALMARVYLQIGNYAKAKENSDACLQLYNALLDFNDSTLVNKSSPSPIPIFNKEVIYFTFTGSCLNASAKAKIDSNLYRSYDSSDLRKVVFFSPNTGINAGTYRFKGSYNGGSVNLFNGIATDEVYLIRAEAYARLDNKNAALNDLDTLLIRRRKAGTFVPSIAVDANEALKKILAERKKELVYRGIRWPDLKRLNKEPQFVATPKRDLNGQSYQIPPNDLRYSLLIPLEIIQLSNLQQNPR